MATLALFTSGSNAQGQLGTGDLEDAHRFSQCIFLGCPMGQFPEGTSAITTIVCGANHTLALLTRCGQQELWGCGDGRRGQLGPSYVQDIGGEPESRAVFRPLDLRQKGLEGYVPCLAAAGWETSYVVFSCPGKGDALLSMGADDFGALGVGGAKGTGAVGYFVHRVPLINAFPDANLQEGVLTVRALSAGPHHVVCVILVSLVDGSATEAIVGWGTARHGQLGDTTSSSQKALPYYASPYVIRIDGFTPTHIPVHHIAVGNQHTVLLYASGRLSAVGSNRKSQRERLESVQDARDVACTWNGTYAVVRDQVVATGSNGHGQLGRGTVEPSGALRCVNFPLQGASYRVLNIACGSEHVLCLLEVDCDGAVHREVWGWGWNEHGNLGVGTTEDASVPVRVWPPLGADSGAQAVGIWGGNGTSWILVER